MDSWRNEQAESESNDAIVSRLAQQDRIPWYNKPNLRLLYFLMVPTCLGVEITIGFDASIINGLQAIPSWIEYYDHPRSASLGLMVAAYSLGAVAALPFAPIIVDTMGRRYPILLGAVISTVGSIIQGFAFNFIMFITARFIIGFASVFSIVAAASLIGELAHPKERPVVGCLFNGFYDIGAVAGAVVTLATYAMTSNWGWRIPSFLQIVPSLLQAFFICFLPESPRWLISRGRRDEAYAILIQYHAEGDKNSEFVKAEYAQIKETLEAEVKTAQADPKAMTPGMRKRIIIAAFLGVSVLWCGVGLVSTFLPLTLDSIGIHDNGTKNIIGLARISWSLVNGTFFVFMVPQYSRRSVFLACTISLFVIFVAWTIATAEYSSTHNKSSAQLVLVLVFCYSPAYNLAFTALLYTYLVELFPFHVRAKGIAIFQFCFRGAAFVNHFVNPIGIDIAGWRWYIVYCVWNAFQVVFVYFMFPETSGRTLEELTFLFEGDLRQERPGDSECDALLR